MKLFGALTLAMAQMASLLPATQASICFLVYQMADNDLEFSIRNDNYEISISEVVRDPSMTTWLYFDHRNLGLGRREDIKDPLQNVYNSDGSTPGRGPKMEGSQYLRWDHTLGKMVIDRTLTGGAEQNSDLPTTISNFLEIGLADCVAKGSTEYMVVFSSHGAGISGFGGDEHLQRQRQLLEHTVGGVNSRALTQTNDSIIGAIKTALANVAGAPTMLDIIGFDACLMQALDAADEYRDVAKYFLASEATEPGHGWAYNELKQANSVMDLAKEIKTTFLESTHGFLKHQTPKTMALVDLAKFSTFLTAWDDFSGEMEALLTAEDSDFFTQVNRARSEAVAFEGGLDLIGTNFPSALDIGSFLQLLQKGCVPALGSGLRDAMDATIDAYSEMFIVQGNGKGTQPSTGMHVSFPSRPAYAEDADYLDYYLFDSSAPYATTDAPQWISFMETYYATVTPPEDGFSVCTLGIGASVTPVPGQLLINPGVSNPTPEGGHDIETETARAVDRVVVEFGVDLTPLLDTALTRLRQKIIADQDATTTRAGDLDASKAQPHKEGAGRTRRRRASASLVESRKEQRRLQSSANDDIFFLFGGDVSGSFNQSVYSAYWDRNFYSIQDLTNGKTDVLFTHDKGDGSKTIPVIWVSDNNTITSEELAELPFGMNEDKYLEALGGQYGFLSFSKKNADAEGTITDGAALYTFDGTTYSETPREAGGQIVPVLYVYGTIAGIELDVMLGGINNTVIDWNNETSLAIDVNDADTQLDTQGLETLIIDIVAYDDDALLDEDPEAVGEEIVSFDISRDGTVTFYGNGAEESENTSGGTSHRAMSLDFIRTALVLAFVGLVF